MKKLTVIVMALMLVLSLSACGAKTASAAEGPVQTAAPAAAETTAAAVEETAAPEAQAAEVMEFVGSVSQKGVPGVEGKLVILDMVDGVIDLMTGKDTVVCEVPVDQLHAVALSERDKAPEDVKQALEAAYEEITEAQSLESLAENGGDALAASGMAADKLVVRDLFDLELEEKYEMILAEEANYIALNFQLDLAAGEHVFLLHRDDAGKWEAVCGEELKVNSDGSVTAALRSLSPIAIVVED